MVKAQHDVWKNVDENRTSSKGDHITDFKQTIRFCLWMRIGHPLQIKRKTAVLCDKIKQ